MADLPTLPPVAEPSFLAWLQHAGDDALKSWVRDRASRNFFHAAAGSGTDYFPLRSRTRRLRGRIRALCVRLSETTPREPRPPVGFDALQLNVGRYASFRFALVVRGPDEILLRRVLDGGAGPEHRPCEDSDCVP